MARRASKNLREPEDRTRILHLTPRLVPIKHQH